MTLKIPAKLRAALHLNSSSAVLLALLAAPAAAQEVRLDAELSARVFGVSTYRAPDRDRRFRDLYTKAEFAPTLHLGDAVSVLAVLKFEPVAEGPGATDRAVDRAFQDHGAFIETLAVEWQAIPRLTLRAGKFTAPFGTGHDSFPGIRLRDNAEIYEISESLGVGATATLVDDEGGWGRHAVSGAVFTLDTTSLSSTWITRKRFGRDEAERYRRGSRGQGGSGNTGRLDNYALSLDGEEIGVLPGFSYHLALLSRGAGRDGTAREWGFAIGAQQEIRWTEELSTTLFAEAVRFNGAGGQPEVVVAPLDRDRVAVDERRTVTTIGARTGYGPWRGTVAWQTDTRRRNVDGLPQGRYFEVSAGRDLPLGFAVDIGWSATRYARDGGGAGRADAALALLSWRAEF
jgi:hypothetical protein